MKRNCQNTINVSICRHTDMKGLFCIMVLMISFLIYMNLVVVFAHFYIAESRFQIDLRAGLLFLFVLSSSITRQKHVYYYTLLWTYITVLNTMISLA